MNRREIQKIFKTIHPPQYGEKQIVWFSKLANKLKWETSRVRDLWKDEKCKISYEEGLQLRNALRISPQSEANFQTKLKETEEGFARTSTLQKEAMNVIVNEILIALGERIKDVATRHI